MYLVALLEAGVRSLEVLEDLRVRVVELTLEVVQARGSEIPEVSHGCQSFSCRRGDEAGDAAGFGAHVEAPSPGLGLGGWAAAGAENE